MALFLRYNLIMFLRFTPRALCLILFFLLLIPVCASSFDNINFATRGSIFYFPTGAGKKGVDPAPILPSVGFSAEWQFWGPLRLELSEDIYFTNYEYNADLGCPLPCNPENRSAFVMGFMTGLQITGFFPVGGKGAGVRIYGGPAADLRIVVLAFGLNHPGDFTGSIETDAQLQTNAIRENFWSNGRWFMPAAGTGMDFPINEKFLIGFDLRTWFPVYRLWQTSENIPKIDGWRFGVSLRITPRKIRK